MVQELVAKKKKRYFFKWTLKFYINKEVLLKKKSNPECKEDLLHPSF